MEMHVGYNSDRGIVGKQFIECVEKIIIFGAQCVEFMSVGWNTRALSDMRRGNFFLSEILLLQLRIWLLTGKARMFLVLARQID
jgi:hypothetical protein